jgi:hypothetical protein
MNISIICACKNREESLKISLQSWLFFEEIKEIIIVDWSSNNSLNYLTTIDSRIKIITVKNEKYFNLSQPLNLAAKIATGDAILKLDCDYILNPYHSFFKNYKLEEGTFISGNHNVKNYEVWNGSQYVIDIHTMNISEIYEYVSTYSHYFKYLKGMLFLFRSDFEKIGGFNETITTYGWEDSDMIYRLESYGLEHKRINFDHSLIHIPHPDRKRFENSESYKKDDEENCSHLVAPGLNEEQKMWQIEYLLVEKYIEENKNNFVQSESIFIKSDITWNIQQVNDQCFIAEKNNKLNNFPSSYYISLEESLDRQENIKKQFDFYHIPITSIISKRFSECNDVVTGPLVDVLDGGTKGCVVSQLKMIKKWYDETDENYAFFCEDDLSLETVDYWDFTWTQFIEQLPNDWECVQLCCIRPDEVDIKLRERDSYDWSVTAYMLTRNYAKKIIDRYCRNDSYHLEICNPELYPMPENVLFHGLGKVYSINLFVENQKLQSTFTKINNIETGQKEYHNQTYNHVINWWKLNGKNSNIISKKTMNNYENDLQKLLTEFALDPENPETNFNLGLWYEKENHTAAALSYFLRSAERSFDDNFTYSALIQGYFCYDRQGTRDGTAKTLLLHALCLLPKRPESYFLFSKFYEKREQWQESYMYAHLGLELCDFNQPALNIDIGYPGKYALLFLKAISGYHWEKLEQTKEILLDIKNNYELNSEYHELVTNNLKNLGVQYEEPKITIIQNNTEVKSTNGFIVKPNLYRPIRNEQDSNVFENKIDIVLQGEYNTFTDDIIRSYSDLPFLNKIILSTWDYESSNISYEVETNPKVQIVYNDLPLEVGTDNRNLQIVSSLSGIKKVATEISVKMRTDQLYTYSSMIKMYEYYHTNKEDHKIFVAGMYPELLFHPRDHIFWGNTQDLIRLFDIPLEYNGFASKLRIDKNDLWKYYSYFIRTETYLGAHYCAKFNDKINLMLIQPENYLHDNSPNWEESCKISKELTSKYFKSFPRTDIELSWPKKDLTNYPYEEQHSGYGECWAEDGY